MNKNVFLLAATFFFNVVTCYASPSSSIPTTDPAAIQYFLSKNDFKPQNANENEAGAITCIKGLVGAEKYGKKLNPVVRSDYFANYIANIRLFLPTNRLVAISAGDPDDLDKCEFLGIGMATKIYMRKVVRGLSADEAKKSFPVCYAAYVIQSERFSHMNKDAGERFNAMVSDIFAKIAVEIGSSFQNEMGTFEQANMLIDSGSKLAEEFKEESVTAKGKRLMESFSKSCSAIGVPEIN